MTAMDAYLLGSWVSFSQSPCYLFAKFLLFILFNMEFYARFSEVPM